MFVMATGHHPFNGPATHDTLLYKSLAAKRSDVFWKYHRENLPGMDIFNNDDFCRLFESMVSLVPRERPSIEEILEHPWMQIAAPS